MYLINQHGSDKIEPTPKFLLVTYFHKKLKQNSIKNFILVLWKPLLRLADPLHFRIVHFFESNSLVFLIKFALDKSDIFLAFLQQPWTLFIILGSEHRASRDQKKNHFLSQNYFLLFR